MRRLIVWKNQECKLDLDFQTILCDLLDINCGLYEKTRYDAEIDSVISVYDRIYSVQDRYLHIAEQ